MDAYFIFASLCVLIVAIQLSRFFAKILYNIFATTFGYGAVNLKEIGGWAVVTGATDGLGKAYADLLAAKGIPIVLISRTESKLETVANEIATKYSVDTKIIAVDFTADDEIYNFIDKQLEGLEIGILINNVGLSYPYPDYFVSSKINNHFIDQLIRCNVYSVTNMCKIVLPGMIERKRGVIVNISSTSARIPSPLLTIYAATKAYVDKLSQNLAIEQSKYGIIIQSVLPGFVATKMSKIRSSTWMAPSPHIFVRDALKTIGVHERTTGYFPHTLMIRFVDAISWISPKLSKWSIMYTMENIRRRAVKREANT